MIDLEITDGVAFITLNAPATRNALNNELAGLVVAACDEADRDEQVGAAVIKGAGGTFCSGAERGHLDEVGRDPAEESRYAALGGIYRAFTRVGQLEMPTIAAVRGAAVGAGIKPRPAAPQMRAVLWTGQGPRYLSGASGAAGERGSSPSRRHRHARQGVPCRGRGATGGSTRTAPTDPTRRCPAFRCRGGRPSR